MPLDALPICPICCDTLGRNGPPATLPCGHNGCCHCLHSIQRSGHTLCPLCRAPFERNYNLTPNTELRDLIHLVTSMVLTDKDRQDGWEAFPDRTQTAEEYAMDLKLGRLDSSPSAPSAPSIPGADAVLAHSALMELTPPQWLPDSMATACGACHVPFRPLTRLRHHCRCCGRIFCHSCSKQKSLLPPKFNCREPERTCDTCAAMLAPLQAYLAATQTPSAQQPVHDAVFDSVSLRAWLNLPYSASLESDVYKAANVLAKFTRASRLQPEAGVPAAVLAGACGLVIMSQAKLGVGWSASFGTGVIVSRSPGSSSWSAPCGVVGYGVGWGLQLGGELTDLLLVLRTEDAVRACCGMVHCGLGGSMGVALGPVGRSADASVMLGSSAWRAPGAAYAYSFSQGAFAGISLESTVLQVRESVNHAFYGLPVTPKQLLVDRSIQPPAAAGALYDALHELTRKFEVKPSAPVPARSWALALPAPPTHPIASGPVEDLLHTPASPAAASAAVHHQPQYQQHQPPHQSSSRATNEPQNQWDHFSQQQALPQPAVFLQPYSQPASHRSSMDAHAAASAPPSAPTHAYAGGYPVFGAQPVQAAQAARGAGSSSSAAAAHGVWGAQHAVGGGRSSPTPRIQPRGTSNDSDEEDNSAEYMAELFG